MSMLPLNQMKIIRLLASLLKHKLSHLLIILHPGLKRASLKRMSTGPVVAGLKRRKRKNKKRRKKKNKRRKSRNKRRKKRRKKRKNNNRKKRKRKRRRRRKRSNRSRSKSRRRRRKERDTRASLIASLTDINPNDQLMPKLSCLSFITLFLLKNGLISIITKMMS